MKLSVIICCYNELASIRDVIEKTKRAQGEEIAALAV